jgi:CRISPR system Cascade subunit CasE
MGRAVTNTKRLHLITFAIDRAKLVSLAAGRGTIPPSGDLGYALHQVLNETFGAEAPKPFHFFDEFGGQLIAYSPHDAETLQQFALKQREQVQAWTAASEALSFVTMRANPLPERWAPHVRYRYSVRTRPVCRVAHHRERGLPRECDVFLRAVAAKSSNVDWIDRQEVYTAWFREQVPEAAIALKSVHISRLGRIQVYRKGAPRLQGPDVTYSGILEVGDPDSFQACLQRGVGRHRAFGFGMLLLGNA